MLKNKFVYLFIHSFFPIAAKTLLNLSVKLNRDKEIHPKLSIYLALHYHEEPYMRASCRASVSSLLILSSDESNEFNVSK